MQMDLPELCNYINYCYYCFFVLFFSVSNFAFISSIFIPRAFLSIGLYPETNIKVYHITSKTFYNLKSLNIHKILMINPYLSQLHSEILAITSLKIPNQRSLLLAPAMPVSWPFLCHGRSFISPKNKGQ